MLEWLNVVWWFFQGAICAQFMHYYYDQGKRVYIHACICLLFSKFEMKARFLPGSTHSLQNTYYSHSVLEHLQKIFSGNNTSSSTNRNDKTWYFYSLHISEEHRTWMDMDMCGRWTYNITT